jgi:hypothetical protein
MWGFSFDELARRAQEEAAKLAVSDEHKLLFRDFLPKTNLNQHFNSSIFKH